MNGLVSEPWSSIREVGWMKVVVCKKWSNIGWRFGSKRELYSQWHGVDRMLKHLSILTGMIMSQMYPESRRCKAIASVSLLESLRELIATALVGHGSRRALRQKMFTRNCTMPKTPSSLQGVPQFTAFLPCIEARTFRTRQRLILSFIIWRSLSKCGAMGLLRTMLKLQIASTPSKQRYAVKDSSNPLFAKNLFALVAEVTALHVWVNTLSRAVHSYEM